MPVLTKTWDSWGQTGTETEPKQYKKTTFRYEKVLLTQFFNSPQQDRFFVDMSHSISVAHRYIQNIPEFISSSVMKMYL